MWRVKNYKTVSTHSRPKAAGILLLTCIPSLPFQHTAARRRLAAIVRNRKSVMAVSTHSRPKAAGFGEPIKIPIDKGFNTQPPEGGWLAY